jgi:ribosomal protein S18 acetylase RimI-like enzyme
MAEIQIRPAVSADLSLLLALDHTCQSEYVWQMDIVREQGQSGAIFREIRLPRPVTVRYPRPPQALAEGWGKRSGVLVALIGEQPAGYVRLNDALVPGTAWIIDLVVAPRYRRQGIGTGLVLEAQSWAAERKNTRAQLEMSSKNQPAIRLAQKLGYEFCGYNDRYYDNQDITLFFTRTLR